MAALTLSGAGGVAGITDAPAERVRVEAIRDVGPGGLFLDWSKRNGTLLFDRRGADRRYTVCAWNPREDSVQSLVLNRKRSTPSVHFGAPAWHPDGASFVFTASNPDDTEYLRNQPDSGIGCSLWIADVRGTAVHQLLAPQKRPEWRGATSPVFSPDGTRLLWSAPSPNREPARGLDPDALFEADYEAEPGGARLGDDIAVLSPGPVPGYCRALGYAPDGRTRLFATNADPDTPPSGLDLYTMAPDGTRVNLTRTPAEWDGAAEYSPDGKRLAWVTDRALTVTFPANDPAQWWRHQRSDLWIAHADATNAVRLTFFNDPKHTHHRGQRVLLTDCSWGPEAKRIAVCALIEYGDYDVRSRILILTLTTAPPTPPPKPSTR